jgi:hypothetical protein
MKKLNIIMILFLSISFSQFQLQIENGYGSGEYSAGDSIHIWANETPGFSIFTGWNGINNLVDYTIDWHTSFIMPFNDLSLSVNYDYLENIQIQVEEIQCINSIKEVYSVFPENYIGVIFLFHGTSGHGVNWFVKVENNIFTKDAISRGFAVIATDSEEATLGDLNGDGFLRWKTLPPNSDENIDIGNISSIIDTFQHRGMIDENIPIFAMGMSNGSNFAPSVSFALNFTATAGYCSKGIPELYAVTEIPTIFCTVENDNTSDNNITFENYQTLIERQIQSEFHENKIQPLYPQRFKRVPEINGQLSQQLFNEIENGGYLGINNYFNVEYIEFVEIIESLPELFPVFHSVETSIQSGIKGQLKNTLAEHAFFSEFNHRVLDFFKSTILLQGDLNNDDLINIIDVILIVNIILSEDFDQIADMNNDGEINIIDIVIMVNIILGISD